MSKERWYITPEDRAKVADAVGRLVRHEVESYEADSQHIRRDLAIRDINSQVTSVILSKARDIVDKCISGSDLTMVEHLRIGKGGDE